MTFTRTQTNLFLGTILVLCFLPFVSPALALATGIVLSLLGVKHAKVSAYIAFSLQASIVLMGFGMNLAEVINASKTGFMETAISVVFVMVSGLLLARLLKVESIIGTLISAGTAICGGNAIAAVAPILNAKNSQISFSLVVIFVLNAIALILFPLMGHYFDLSQETFGTWAAIAIHDTSSVVGAGATYGPKALEVATTVKLIRALWIIPLSLVIAFTHKGTSTGKIQIPWFIGLFVISIVIAWLFPQGAALYAHFSWLGKRGMVLALFLVGLNISFADVKEAGTRSFILGVSLWILIGVSSFLMLK